MKHCLKCKYCFFSGQFNNKHVIVSDSSTITFLPKGETVKVRRWSERHALHGTKEPCWLGARQGEGFIDGHYTDYIVSELLDGKL